MSIVHVAFYPSDWLAGTRGLSAEETGVYITLICRMYEMAGPIERDDNRLARLCGCKTKNAFIKCLDYLISDGKIIETEDGLFNERAQKEIKNTTEKSDKAKAAAQSRWDRKSNKNNADRHADASSKHMPERCQSEPEPYKKESTNVLLSDQPSEPDQIEDAIKHFNAKAAEVGWPAVQKPNPQRRSALKARIKDVGGFENWIAAIDRASVAPWLIGANGRGWKANFDWLLKPANFTKLMEGNYDPDSNTGQHGPDSGRSGPHNDMVAAFAQVAAERSGRT